MDGSPLIGLSFPPLSDCRVSFLVLQSGRGPWLFPSEPWEWESKRIVSKVCKTLTISALWAMSGVPSRSPEGMRLSMLAMVCRFFADRHLQAAVGSVVALAMTRQEPTGGAIHKMVIPP
jgi:hypothetical protein